MTQTSNISLNRCLKTLLLGFLPLFLFFGETARAAVPLFLRTERDQQQCGAKTTSWSTDPTGAGGKIPSNGWPWTASLQFYDFWTGYHNHVCGATLIDAHWAVTAAHCVDPRLTSEGRDDPLKYKVVVGATDLVNPSGYEQIMDIDKIIKHPNFVADRVTGFPNDIALIHMTEAVDATHSSAGFACIPDADTDFSSADECWISGWGAADYYSSPTETLNEFQTSIITPAKCAAFMDAKEATVLDSHICAGGTDEKTPNACKGDSGGPLSCRKGTQWYAAGIYSWNYWECKPSIYVKLSSYRSWIQSVARI